MNSRNHIAVIGAGLIGSLLSIYLAKRGYKVSVFERRADMRVSNTEAGRSINLALSTRGIKALEEVGLADVLKSVAIPMHGRMMHDLQGNLSFLPYGREGQYINSISRSGLNEVLMNEAEKHNVTFHFNNKCLAVDFEQTSLTLHDLNSKQNVTKEFDLIIGADGAFSAIRSAMQITDRFNYAQHYIEHSYKELHIPAGENNKHLLEKNALHIWPRESFMMIALPNPDGSFTCTLFLANQGSNSFNSLTTSEDISTFLTRNFPDAVKLIPGLINQYHTNPTSSLVMIKCFPWVKNKTLVIGDAAHAIVPFYGQGMNAGFEDCRILNNLLSKHNDNWPIVLEEFQTIRKPDTDAIAELALSNFIEMRDLVADPKFLLRKKIEAKLHELYPDKWIPLYSMVTFNDSIRYSEALAMGRKQQMIMDKILTTPEINATWQQLNFKEIVSQLER
ncbi:FAD-dependent oxidoreductase [Chryseosolibacter indicus]|uniref:Kynurenine 3-monooxygenase n=1 Tax=Chryseosolibacter indicus TaxID=2782351 RepID=A0ABS5VQC2_9BACT|nr:NAD(P)/FAD-dependent oxidoreductase [Chryseosolibacter indicus]MBT1702997.1 FAD-dependent monooxygenase [Chryseosolibacter indicus]